ncbi:hypothetical protein ACFYZE_22940 [Streptomyces sp. NPDC001796]|uniref:hypothetical protein n=1 Tax=Streptomyces sp. NPDC001796 TaxID=3364609 RepID=UPI0036A9FE56
MSSGYPFDDADTARALIDDEGVLVEWNEGARRPQLTERSGSRHTADGKTIWAELNLVQE